VPTRDGTALPTFLVATVHWQPTLVMAATQALIAVTTDTPSWPQSSSLRTERPDFLSTSSTCVSPGEEVFTPLPRRMPAELAAGYCGETTVDDFLKRVGKDYPQPRVAEGRRRLWLMDNLDAAIAPSWKSRSPFSRRL
jgi:hypothetical protein